MYYCNSGFLYQKFAILDIWEKKNERAQTKYGNQISFKFFYQTTNLVSKTTSKSQVKIISLRVVLASAVIGELPLLQVGVETSGGFMLHRKSVVLHPPSPMFVLVIHASVQWYGEKNKL